MKGLWENSTSKLTPEPGKYGIITIILLLALFIAVVVGVIAITKSQRRIPTQSAKHVRGRRVFGGTRQYLPLKVNQAGVMPIIFASQPADLPVVRLQQFVAGNRWPAFRHLDSGLGHGQLLPDWPTPSSGRVTSTHVCYIILIYFFCYFWTAITFNPKDMADNLKDYGSFHSGLSTREADGRLSREGHVAESPFTWGLRSWPWSQSFRRWSRPP